METKANYALVGAFTLAVIAGAFAFIYWFADLGSAKQRKTLDIIFSDSVSGLSVGASVLFNGIPVGQVMNIRIRPEDPRQVEVRTRIDDGTPLRMDTTAMLEYQGLTGAASISLTGGDPRAADLVAAKGDDFPELYAKRSDFQSLMESARNIAARADDLVTRMDKLVGDNQESITKIVKNVENFSDVLGDSSSGVKRFLDQIGDSGKGALDEVHAAAASIKKLSDHLEGQLNEIAEGLKRFTGSGLQQYQNLAVEGRKSLNELNKLIQGIQRNPQQFILGPRSSMPQYNGR
ncbi:MlaD family protein [Microvirga sp. W0021]|uniref:MlaD family protein n=1 Tax=Hohaiivirga grylli TaxID=3133970 RepID=A0ABV0BM84_9HYPH